MDKADVTPAKRVHEEKNQINVFSLKGEKIVWMRQGWKLTLNKRGIKSSLKSRSMESFENYKSAREPHSVMNPFAEPISY